MSLNMKASPSVGINAAYQLNGGVRSQFSAAQYESSNGSSVLDLGAYWKHGPKSTVTLSVTNAYKREGKTFESYAGNGIIGSLATRDRPQRAIALAFDMSI